MQSAFMPMARRTLGAAFLAAMITGTSAAAPLLELERTIAMPGVKGRIDHLAVDVAGHRIFVAALGNDTVEVLDTQRGERRSLTGFGEPQGVAYLAKSGRLFVANGQADRVDVLDGTKLTVVKRVAGMPDSDNVRFDDAADRIHVGYGRGALRALDAQSGEPVGEVALPGHPESFQLERRGPRVFVNVPSAHKVVVVDRARRAVLASWDVPVSSNFPMALDEEGRRLFVGARSPATLVVYDIDSGKVAAQVAVGADTDDVFYDAERKRVYVVCGEGRVDVVRQDGPDRYSVEASVQTAPRARTGLFVPEESRLYVAAPAADAVPARVLVYRIH